jgi:hypothetical protein
MFEREQKFCAVCRVSTYTHRLLSLSFVEGCQSTALGRGTAHGDMFDHGYVNTCIRHVHDIVCLQDALSGVDSFQRSVALWLRGFNDEKPYASKGAPAPLCPLSQAQLHAFDVDALVESTCMHEDVACVAASAAVAAAGAESQCGCAGRPPNAHCSRHAGARLGPNDAIYAYDTFQCFGALANESYTRKEASQECSVASDHACGVTQMRMASESAAERVCVPIEEFANEVTADPTSRFKGGCLLETAQTDEGFTEAAQPLKLAGEADGKRGPASRHACDTPQFPCIRDAAARAINCAVAQTTGVQGVAADFEARRHVSQEAAASACAHAMRHCIMSRCDGIAACNSLQLSEEAGFSGDGRHAACAAGVMCSQHASPQQTGGGGILGTAADRYTQLGGHGVVQLRRMLRIVVLILRSVRRRFQCMSLFNA